MGVVTYGYVWSLEIGSDQSGQIDALREQGIEADHVYVDERVPGKKTRPQFSKLIRKLHKDDVLIVPSLGCLGQSSAEIAESWEKVTKAKKADIVVLDMPLLDTRTTPYNMAGALVEDVVLQLLSGIEELERANRSRIQAEGIARAKAKGVHCGRAPLPKPESFEEVRKFYLEGAITRKEAANQLGVSVSTLDKWLRESRGQESKGTS